MSIDEYSMTRRSKEEEELLNKQKSQSEQDESENPHQIDISRYRDSTGLSVSNLDFGLWVLENKTSFKNMLFFVVFVLGVFAWLFFFYQYGAYVFNGIKQERVFARQILAQNLPDHSYYRQEKVKDIEMLPVRVLAGNAGKKDVVGQISNPNSEYWVRFTYYFESNGERISEKEGFALPDEKKKLLKIGVDSDKIGTFVSMGVEDLRWGRVNPHDFGNWQKFSNNHLDFDYSDIVFTPANNTEVSERISLNTLSFTIKNKSDYNYWELPLIISLYSYGNMVSVAQYRIDDFESAQTRNINFTWPGNFANISKVEIDPDLDITSLDIYKDFGAPTGNFR